MDGARKVTFYLGVHKPQWLGKMGVPLFLSRCQLQQRKSLPRSREPWALDSGAFSELSLRGEWGITHREYVAEVRRYDAEIGNLRWSACCDWMCEPFILKKTGLSIREHQRRTVESVLELRQLAPELRWLPVLQGWEVTDYLFHWEQYWKAGIDLEREPCVGVGSVCRRQHTVQVANIVRALQPLKLHAFGVKLGGLTNTASMLQSSDSMAWSFHARRRPPLPGCTHQNCANCARYAMLWRTDLLVRINRLSGKPQQLLLDFGTGIDY